MSGSFYIGDYVHVTKKNTNGAYLVNAYGAITRWKYGKSGNILYQVHFEYGKFKNTEDYFYGSRLSRSSPQKAKAATITQTREDFAEPQPKIENEPYDLKNGAAAQVLKSLLLALDLAVEAEHSHMKSESEETKAARDKADERLRNELEKARELAST